MTSVRLTCTVIKLSGDCGAILAVHKLFRSIYPVSEPHGGVLGRSEPATKRTAQPRYVCQQVRELWQVLTVLIGSHRR
jgi:hypothetical protein